MDHDHLKLTIYFGETDRTRGRLLCEALSDIYDSHGVSTHVLLRGIEGFGVKHQLHTDRLLTLSEDLPLVSIAVGPRDQITALLPEVTRITQDGLISLERARLVEGRLGLAEMPDDLHDATKLTIYCGRGDRVGSQPAYRAVVEDLRRHGLAGATVLMGVDGSLHGLRQRARFFSGNAGVPLMIISVGTGRSVSAAAASLGEILPTAVFTLERVRLCKRDGTRLGEPRHVADTDESGLGIWQKLMIYAGEDDRHEGHAISTAVIQRLRREGAAGATALRGLWGYSHDGTPHGDVAWAIRRRAPIITVVIDRPGAIRRWFAAVDEITQSAGLVTSELVPAAQGTGPEIRHGGLRLATHLRFPRDS
jgi:PII-like signaling protein